MTKKYGKENERPLQFKMADFFFVCHLSNIFLLFLKNFIFFSDLFGENAKMVGGKNVKSLGGEIFISERERDTHTNNKRFQIYIKIYKKRDPIKRYRELPGA
jgi:hypothetical protein